MDFHMPSVFSMDQGNPPGHRASYLSMVSGGSADNRHQHSPLQQHGTGTPSQPSVAAHATDLSMVSRGSTEISMATEHGYLTSIWW